MTADDAARAEAEDYARTPRMNVGTVRDRIAEAHLAGSAWGREQALAQEPTDAEVEAAARALWAEVWIDPDEHPWDTEATEAERASCRREARAALSAARAARRDEEKR